MPRIPFDAGAGGFRPTEVGIEATAAAARRINASFNQVSGALSGLGAETAALGNREARATAAEGAALGSGIEAAGGLALKYQEHRELTQGTAALSGFLDAKTKQWDDAVKSADPNDTTISQNFREGLETDFQKFRDGFLTEKGRQWADAHIASARQHFYQKTSADMSSLAGAALKNNVQTTADNLTSTAMRSPDFHTVDYLLGTVDSTVGSMVESSPNVRGVDAAKLGIGLKDDLKRRIVKAATLGAVQNSSDPEATVKQFADKYGDYLEPETASQMGKVAKAQNKQNMLAEKQSILLTKQIEGHAVKTEAAKVFNDYVTFDPATNKAIIDPKFFKAAGDIAKRHPEAENAVETVKSLWNYGQSQGEKITSDKTVQADLMGRIFDPNNPTTELEVIKAAGERKLDSADTHNLLGLVKTIQDLPLKGPVISNTLKGVEATLGRDPNGVDRYGAFMRAFVPEYTKQIRAGTLPPNALDTRDPQSMISQYVRQFDRPPEEKMRAYTTRNLGGFAPSAPGSQPAPAAHPDVPAELRGIAALSWSPSRQQWYDQTERVWYDRNGKRATSRATAP